MVEQCRRLVDRWVGEHLRSQGDGTDWRLELVGHVVDEVVFHLAEFLLSEHHYDDEQEEDEHDDREGKRRHHEGQATVEEELVALWEIDLDVADSRRDIVVEQRLQKDSRLLGFLCREIWSVIDYRAVLVDDAEVVVEEDAHALKLIVERDEQLVDVQSLQYRLVVGLRQDAENHIIEQVLLIDILLHQHIVQRLLAVLYRALAMSRRQVERRDPCRVGHRTLELERRSRAIRSLYYDLVVRHIGRHSVLTIMGKRFEKLSLGLVVVFLKIGSCLGSLKLTRHSPQTALHGIVKLLASSTDYLLKI